MVACFPCFQELAENLEIVTAERQVQSDKLKQLKEDWWLGSWVLFLVGIEVVIFLLL